MTDREHEVFISYSSKNKNIADAIVADLEQNGIKCWYAPRDILVGDDWAGAIKNAIESTKIFVLVFTDESNQSHQVTNEVTLAVNSGKIIIPFRMSSSDMNDTLVYYLSSVHWLDAVSKPLNANIETLRKQIWALLEINEGAAAGGKAVSESSAGSVQSSSTGGNINGSSNGSSKKTGILIGIVVAVLAVCIGTFALSGGSKKTDSSQDTANAEAQAVTESDAEETAEPDTQQTAEADAQDVEEPAADAAQEPAKAPEPAAADAQAEQAEEPATAPAEAAEEVQEAEETAPEPIQQAEEEVAEDTTVMIPDNALSYNGHHYYIYNDIKTNWDEAASNCRDRGGYLAVINDAKENEKIYKYMTAMGYDQAFFGLTYSHGKDDWVYLDGDSSDYRDWGCNSKGEAEPNNASGSEYHVQFDVNMQDGHWNDAKFGAKVYTPEGASYKNKYTYICEWDQ